MRSTGGSSVPSKERSDTSRTSIKGEFVTSKPKAHRVRKERGSFVALDTGQVRVSFIYQLHYVTPGNRCKNGCS